MINYRHRGQIAWNLLLLLSASQQAHVREQRCGHWPRSSRKITTGWRVFRPPQGYQVTSPPDHYEKVAASLGHLVIAFNELEVSLGGALMYLLKQDEDVGAAFVAHLGASQKIRLLQELESKIDHQDTRQEFHDIVFRVDEINSQRNRLIHSEYWSVHATEQLHVLLHRRLRDSTKPVKFPVTMEELSKKYVQAADPEEIMDLANDAADLATRLIQLSENLY